MNDPIIINQELSAGEFLAWLNQIRLIQKTGGPMNVPCGECTACCTSSYFIHIKPHETKTIAKIPKDLMFPAPGLSKGNVLLGFNEKGHCPMFIDNKCLIYDSRPETCRSYDCRIFTATGLQIDDDKVLISQQARKWKFHFNGKDALKNYHAVQAAAKFINKHASAFPHGFIPSNTPQKAMIAIKTYEVFLSLIDMTEKDINLNPDDKTINVIINTYKRFEQAKNAHERVLT